MATKDALKPRVILKMSVQLPAGQKGVIHVFPGSDPHGLAEAFCNKHDLHDAKLRQVVERHIIENMAQLKRNPAKSSKASGPKPWVEHSLPASMDRRNSCAVLGLHSIESAAAPPQQEQVLASNASTAATAVRRVQLRAKAIHALSANLWEARLRRAVHEAEERSSKAREAEMGELHAANARIAQLAFAQAGRTEQRATADLIEDLLEPGGMGGACARLREQLDRVLKRDLRRRHMAEAAALQRHAWQSWVGMCPPHTPSRAQTAQPAASAVAVAANSDGSDVAGSGNDAISPAAGLVAAAFVSQATAANSAPKVAASFPASALVSTLASAAAMDCAMDAGTDAVTDAENVHLSGASVASAAREAELTLAVARLQAEVEELTMQLIQAKLNQAELETTNLTMALDMKALNKQLVADAVDVPYAPPPSKSRANGHSAAVETRQSLPPRSGVPKR